MPSSGTSTGGCSRASSRDPSPASSWAAISPRASRKGCCASRSWRSCCSPARSCSWGDMYRYDTYDHALVAERVAQFRDQTERFLAGKLSEDEFRPLRLRNGLYIQKYAPMLRISISYGVLSATELRKLAHNGRK